MDQRSLKKMLNKLFGLIKQTLVRAFAYQSVDRPKFQQYLFCLKGLSHKIQSFQNCIGRVEGNTFTEEAPCLGINFVLETNIPLLHFWEILFFPLYSMELISYPLVGGGFSPLKHMSFKNLQKVSIYTEFMLKGLKTVEKQSVDMIFCNYLKTRKTYDRNNCVWARQRRQNCFSARRIRILSKNQDMEILKL